METLTLAPPPPRRRSFLFHQISVLLLTFSAYAAFHASRKPPSIVKSILGPEVAASNASADAGWPPFDGPHGPHRLGELDLAFLSSYSAGMYLAGHVGDRIDLRRFLAFGMLGSGISTAAFGMGYWWGVHRLGFFLAVQIVSGLFQSIGWPCVVSVVGNWFGKSKRGLIMGAWNSHTSVGNILGSVVASSVLEFGWGWSFVLPGILIIIVGAFVLAFLVVDPKDLGFESQDMEIEMNDAVNELGGSANGANGEEVGLLGSGEKSDLDLKTADLDSKAAIGFLEAWKLPSVAPYAFCLFFSKLVAYTFLYWLPFYIRHTAVSGKHLSHKSAGILSTIFDIGGVFGGISSGFISDRLGARAVTSVLFLLFSIPSLILYRLYGSISMHLNIGLMFLSGYFVNGPYSLITTAVAADLGTQDMIKGNSRALATVTAIIDGTGSVGAALGPLLTGYISPASSPAAASASAAAPSASAVAPSTSTAASISAAAASPSTPAAAVASTSAAGSTSAAASASISAAAAAHESPPTDEAPTEGASSSRRNVRGPTCMPNVWNRQHQLMIEYDAEGMPVGPAREMQSFFGVLVRRADIIPVVPGDWRLMDPAVKDRIWTEIWRRYDFPDHERAREACLQRIGELYRHYRIRLHRWWVEHRRDTDDELVPWSPDCPPIMWEGMVRHWRSQQFLDISRRNRENRVALQFTHTLGR